MIYTIKTPNPQYNGITEGVPFVNGEAKVESEYVRNVLVNNYGYLDATVTKPSDKTAEPVTTESPTEDKAPAKRKSSAK